MRLVALILLETTLLLWLYFAALRRNSDRLRYYISQEYDRSPNKQSGDLWVHGGRGIHSFALCRCCIDRLMLPPAAP